MLDLLEQIVSAWKGVGYIRAAWSGVGYIGTAWSGVSPLEVQRPGSGIRVQEAARQGARNLRGRKVATESRILAAESRFLQCSGIN